VSRHEQLWAPWRLAYITGEPPEAKASPKERPLALLPGADPQCFLCRAVVDTADRENLVVERSTYSVVMLNRFPYNNGHLLIAPLIHLGRLDELNEHQRRDIDRLITKYVGLIERLMKAEGFNIGLNLGKAAGAGVPGHLHWHVVPRWNGDTNFMPAIAGVRVIPQSLDALWELLQEANAASPPAE
jgi:ATP adenylyltransferase